MKQANAANLKAKHGKKLYEPWMDYKEDLRRLSTPGSTPSAPAPASDQPRYRFNNEYAESVSMTPSVASASIKRTPPVIRTPTPPVIRTPTRTPVSRKSTPKPASRERTPTEARQVVRRTPPPPYPSNEDYSKDRKLIGKIEVEFKAFYTWTTNGSEHDLTREHIMSLLFPEHEDNLH